MCLLNCSKPIRFLRAITTRHFIGCCISFWPMRATQYGQRRSPMVTCDASFACFFFWRQSAGKKFVGVFATGQVDAIARSWRRFFYGLQTFHLWRLGFHDCWAWWVLHCVQAAVFIGCGRPGTPLWKSDVLSSTCFTMDLYFMLPEKNIWYIPWLGSVAIEIDLHCSEHSAVCYPPVGRIWPVIPW